MSQKGSNPLPPGYIGYGYARPAPPPCPPSYPLPSSSQHVVFEMLASDIAPELARRMGEKVREMLEPGALVVWKTAGVGQTEAPSSWWLIEVVGMEGRGPRYFDGTTTLGWFGRTTPDHDKAVKYAEKQLAEADIAKLCPRDAGMGHWAAIEHAWDPMPDWSSIPRGSVAGPEEFPGSDY